MYPEKFQVESLVSYVRIILDISVLCCCSCHLFLLRFSWLEISTSLGRKIVANLIEIFQGEKDLLFLLFVGVFDYFYHSEH